MDFDKFIERISGSRPPLEVDIDHELMDYMDAAYASYTRGGSKMDFEEWLGKNPVGLQYLKKMIVNLKKNKLRRCPDCDGNGQVHGRMGYYDCPRCDTSGIVKEAVQKFMKNKQLNESDSKPRGARSRYAEYQCKKCRHIFYSASAANKATVNGCPGCGKTNYIKEFPLKKESYDEPGGREMAQRRIKSNLFGAQFKMMRPDPYPSIVDEVKLDIKGLREIGEPIPAGLEDYVDDNQDEIIEYRNGGLKIHEITDMLRDMYKYKNESVNTKGKKCSECGGSGKYQPSFTDTEEEINKPTKCPKCKGTGMIKEESKFKFNKLAEQLCESLGDQPIFIHARTAYNKMSRIKNAILTSATTMRLQMEDNSEIDLSLSEKTPNYQFVMNDGEFISAREVARVYGLLEPSQVVSESVKRKLRFCEGGDVKHFWDLNTGRRVQGQQTGEFNDAARRIKTCPKCRKENLKEDTNYTSGFPYRLEAVKSGRVVGSKVIRNRDDLSNSRNWHNEKSKQGCHFSKQSLRVRTEAKKQLPIFHPKKSKLRAKLHKLQDKDKLAFDHPRVEKLKKQIVSLKESSKDQVFDKYKEVPFTAPGYYSTIATTERSEEGERLVSRGYKRIAGPFNTKKHAKTVLSKINWIGPGLLRYAMYWASPTSGS